MWVGDYGCFLVYETLDSCGSRAVSKTSLSRSLPCEEGDAPSLRNTSEGILLGLLRASNPIPQRSQIFIVERHPANVFIKLDRMPQSLFCLLHAARNASIARKVECDYGTPRVYRSCPQQNGFCPLYALAPSDRIGEFPSPLAHKPFNGCGLRVSGTAHIAES